MTLHRNEQSVNGHDPSFLTRYDAWNFYAFKFQFLEEKQKEFTTGHTTSSM